MKADHDQPPAHLEQAQRLRQQLNQVIQLAVDMDSNALECPRRRMLVLLPTRVGLTDNLRQATCGHNRCLGARCNDGTGDPACKALLAELFQYRGDILLGRSPQPLRCGLAAAGVHTHIQRTIVLETEAALAVVELRAGDPEVEQDAVDSLDITRSQLGR